MLNHFQLHFNDFFSDAVKDEIPRLEYRTIKKEIKKQFEAKKTKTEKKGKVYLNHTAVDCLILFGCNYFSVNTAMK